MGATHDGLTEVTVSLDPVATVPRSFGAILFLADQAAGTTLGGTDRVRRYTTPAGVLADAAVLGAAAEGAAAAMFAQARRPTAILIGRVNTAASETYAQALAACIVADPDFFGVCIDSRDSAVIEAVALAVEALGTTAPRLFMAQSKVAGLLATPFPSALEDLVGLKWTALVYHDEDAEPFAEAYLAFGLSKDLDAESGTWLLDVVAVDGLTASISETQLAALRTNNVNVGLPHGTAVKYVAPGVTMNGLPIYHAVTSAWFTSRVRDSLIDARVKASARGQKIVLDETGQAIAFSAVSQWLIRGAAGASPHFLPGQYEVTLPTITDADRSARQIRVNSRATFAEDALGFNASGNFGTSLIFTEG